MLLLGVVQAQAFETAAAGSYDLLATEILTGSQASVTFSSLGDYASTYQHLQIRMVTRNTFGSGTVRGFNAINFNGDFASNYNSHILSGTGSAVSSIYDTYAGAGAGDFPYSSSEGSDYGAAVIDILDPFENTKNKTIRSIGGHTTASQNRIVLTSGLWRNTSPVTSITCIPVNAHSFRAGSRFSLYGLRK